MTEKKRGRGKGKDIGRRVGKAKKETGRGADKGGLKWLNYIDIGHREVLVSVVFQEQSWVVTNEAVPVVAETELPVLAPCESED